MKVFNTTYNNPKTDKEIETIVGKPFSFIEKIKMGGSGSPRFKLTTSDIKTTQILSYDNNTNFATLEIRKAGVIIYFRAILESYSITIPFRSLSIFYSDKALNIYCNSHKFALTPSEKGINYKKFIRKLQEYKTGFTCQNMAHPSQMP